MDDPIPRTMKEAQIGRVKLQNKGFGVRSGIWKEGLRNCGGEEGVNMIRIHCIYK